MGKCSVTPVFGGMVQTGRYVGNGEGKRFIDLGRTPKAFIAFADRGFENSGGYLCGGFAETGLPAMSPARKPNIEICTGGVYVYYSNLSANAQYANTPEAEIRFIAVFDS